jgi:hypothetical protein
MATTGHAGSDGLIGTLATASSADEVADAWHDHVAANQQTAGIELEAFRKALHEGHPSDVIALTNRSVRERARHAVAAHQSLEAAPLDEPAGEPGLGTSRRTGHNTTS